MPGLPEMVCAAILPGVATDAALHEHGGLAARGADPHVQATACRATHDLDLYPRLSFAP